MNRYTPLPPIASPTPSAFGDDDVEEPPDGLQQALPELKRRIRRLQDFPELDTDQCQRDVYYVYSSCEKWARKAETVDRFCQKMVDFHFMEMYKNMWKTNFSEEFFSSEGQPQTLAQLIHSNMWNLSDKSNEVCTRIMQVKLHKDLFDYLKSNPISPNRLRDDQTRSHTTQGMIGILHNVVQRAPGAREAFRECNAVDIMQTYRTCDNMMLSTVALMIQAYIVTEEENEKINSKIETFKFLIEILKCSIRKVSYHQVNFAVIEVIEVINKLASNDSNKVRIVDSGALPYYVQCMGDEFGARVQREAAHGLWTLAFKCRQDILNQSGCLEGLRRLASHNDEEIKKEADGALWILEEKEKAVEKAAAAVAAAVENDQQGAPRDTGHVFISYQWDAKPTVLRVRDKLKAAGFNVWIDEDDMSGSVLEAMATAVEKAAVVVVCLSQKYKDSPSCRTEAEYTFRLRKKIVPLRLQPKYYPDGWLGIMVGSKLVFDVSIEEKVEPSINHLVKELSNVNKDEADGLKATVANNPPPVDPSSTSSAVKSWTQDDINKWLQDNNLQNFPAWITGMTGPQLYEYANMSKTAPEALFQYCIKKDVDLPDALTLSKALKEL